MCHWVFGLFNAITGLVPRWCEARAKIAFLLSRFLRSLPQIFYFSNARSYTSTRPFCWKWGTLSRLWLVLSKVLQLRDKNPNSLSHISCVSKLYFCLFLWNRGRRFLIQLKFMKAEIKKWFHYWEPNWLLSVR